MIRLEGFGGINWTQLRDFPAKKTVQFSLNHAIGIIVAFMVQFFRFIWLPSTKNRKVFKVSNEDPEKLFKNILLLILFITVPYSVIIFQNSLKNGIKKRIQNQMFINWSTFIIEIVSNNWMSYMTNKTFDHQTRDVLTWSTIILVTFTFIHSSATYLFIRIFLWVKHSKTIVTAEESFNFSILGFKKLLIFISCICCIEVSIIQGVW